MPGTETKHKVRDVNVRMLRGGSGPPLLFLHGANGLRTIINDYAERANTRLWLKGLLYTATVFTILLGTLVIFTFDPNIR